MCEAFDPGNRTMGPSTVGSLRHIEPAVFSFDYNAITTWATSQTNRTAQLETAVFSF